MPDLTLSLLYFFVKYREKKNETKKYKHIKHVINSSSEWRAFRKTPSFPRASLVCLIWYCCQVHWGHFERRMWQNNVDCLIIKCSCLQLPVRIKSENLISRSTKFLPPKLKEELRYLGMNNRLLQSLQPVVKRKHSVHCNYAMHHNLSGYVQSKCRLIIININFWKNQPKYLT